MSKSDESPKTSLLQSIQDKKLADSAYLKEVSSRIQDVAKELTNIHDNFETFESDLPRIHKSSLVSLKKTIVPFLNESATKISSSVQLFTPITGLNYIHARNEKKRKSEMKEMESHKRKIKKSSSLKRIESVVFGQKPQQTITISNLHRSSAPRAAKNCYTNHLLFRAQAC